MEWDGAQLLPQCIIYVDGSIVSADGVVILPHVYSEYPVSRIGVDMDIGEWNLGDALNDKITTSIAMGNITKAIICR